MGESVTRYGRWSAVTAVVAALAVMVGGLAARPASAAVAGVGAGGADDAVLSADYRLVCHLPASGNRQGVLGSDGGAGLVHNGRMYFAFGDTFVDNNGDGQAQAYEMRTGTIGVTGDLDPTDCIDGLEYTASAHGGDAATVQAAVEPDPALRECLTWPDRPFVANGTIYFFYSSVQYEPGSDCNTAADSYTFVYATGLAKITDPDAPDLGIQRVGEYGSFHFRPGQPAFTRAVRIHSWIYLFTGHSGTRVARVPIKRVEDVTRYRYWTGEKWSTEPEDAAVLSDDIRDVTYNQALGRFVMVFPCRDATAVCMRMASTPGKRPEAMTGPWGNPFELFDCVFCGHASVQSLADPNDPSHMYVTTGTLGGVGYHISLWELTLAAARPAGRMVWNPEIELLRSYRQSPWSAVAFSQSGSNATITPLAEQKRVRFGSGVHSEFDVSVSSSIPDRVQVAPGDTRKEPGPGVFVLGAYPSGSRGAGRMWTAPAAGKVAFSGEAWLERTCGDGARLRILKVTGSNNAVEVLRAAPLTAAWEAGREERFHASNIVVAAGDRIIFGVTSGPSGNAVCDLSIVRQTVTFDPVS